MILRWNNSILDRHSVLYAPPPPAPSARAKTFSRLSLFRRAVQYKVEFHIVWSSAAFPCWFACARARARNTVQT